MTRIHMRVLFVPNLSASISHGFPLLALSRRLLTLNCTTAFLLPREMHDLFRSLGANVLDISHNSIATELLGYSRFKPTAVIEDASFTTSIASALGGVPRIAIQRFGSFPNAKPRNPNHKHSLGRDLETEEQARHLGLSLPDANEPAAAIIPAIQQIEPMPADFPNHASYHYCGPLLIEDLFSETGSYPTHNLRSVEEFLERNGHVPIVYLTFGNIAQANPQILIAVRKMLAKGIAVVSNVAIDGLQTELLGLYFHGKYLPMNLICSRASLVLHHCGSGTYHYPIMHGVAGIVLGTQCFDRDDIGARLQDLGACIYIPNSGKDDHDQFDPSFEHAVETYLDQNSQKSISTRAVLGRLAEKIRITSSAFQFERLLDNVVK